jgi:DMSO/TMAO reductase YedYZ heme-binding membrane subunit
MLVLLVLLGIMLSHPWRTRLRRPSSATRIRIHVVLSVFTFAFIVLHVVVLATDRYAGVGWAGAFLPMHASYRPVAMTLGLIGLWSGLLAGVTAAFARRLPPGLWFPLHKVASVTFVLVWLHGVFGGTDNHSLMALYLGTAALIVVFAVSRYGARTPADRVAELIG